MAPPASVFLPILAALAAAKSLNEYVPACGAPCLSNTISASTTCAADDNACLCEMKYTLKRNSQACLQDNCDDAQYGQVMTGIDSFCRDAGAGTPPSSPAPTVEPPAPTGYPTAEPPVETTISDPSYSPSVEPPVYPTEVPTDSVSSSETTSIDTPTVTYGTDSTSIDTPTLTYGTESPSVTLLPPVTVTPTTAISVGTTSQSTLTSASQSQPPSTTPSQSPIAAGVQQRAGYAAVAGGLLVAAFFGF
ncbi:uncharacterized protein B0I36DRAFT_354589 [Microdochium trichocladiopsis]|uniref:CFEM domain-containing protein n=1 Tax=Microdochium trichocladiopsis TaxID=1682393 RepID=A0A9P8XUT4_9PEZI|nr:uncharacterized protein B0I36DRAFT_354589 [Microdochium trichocladiopsis]KAH7018295.1 hypothetical protein B0I36DRAFT_354589 [Microdochium trichocladiopsis]